METIVGGRMKRRAVGEIFDDFTDLSLSAPATKIRRLDAEFPPFMVERQQVVESMLDVELSEAAPNAGVTMNESSFPPVGNNEERALVLYKPVYSQLDPFLNINPELLTGLRRCSDIVQESFGKGYHNNCLAVVPWAPSECHPTATMVELPTSRSGLLEEPMEIEDDQSAKSGIECESFHQWQKHCLLPKLTQTTTAKASPIT
ncbi:uncharacterized protein LOC110105306 [Dendrobium catenatum]|uniref:uncharacterized protein LOC110105306 n=1 Tax=Dendrobium catenatum TaxID=906689 RepID=UPI0009F19F7B|nr:uncharacterized protein LOC110105306 [Dendrobium catenatum]